MPDGMEFDVEVMAMSEGNSDYLYNMREVDIEDLYKYSALRLAASFRPSP